MNCVKRTVEYALTALLLLAILFGVVASGMLFAHECTGERCAICLMTERCLRGMGGLLAVAGLAWLIQLASAILGVCPLLRHQGVATDPVSLKVKLSN